MTHLDHRLAPPTESKRQREHDGTIRTGDPRARASGPAAGPRPGGGACRGRGQGSRNTDFRATRRPMRIRQGAPGRSPRSSRGSTAKPSRKMRSKGVRSSTRRSKARPRPRPSSPPPAARSQPCSTPRAIRPRATTPPARPRPPPATTRARRRLPGRTPRRASRSKTVPAWLTRSGIDWRSWPPSTRNSGSIPTPRRPRPSHTRNSAIPAMSSSPGCREWISPCASWKD